MSAWDVTGVVVWTALALFWWMVTLIPSKPPAPPYGETELVAFCLAVPCSALAVFCFARLAGAHL